MFDVQFAAGIRDVKLKVKSKDGVETRKVIIAFEREFDDLIAAGMGSGARSALASLRSRDMESCVLPLDAVRATAELTAGLGETITLHGLKGIKATGSGPSDEGFPPSIKLEFEFTFAPRPWAFFGEYSGQSCAIELTRQQLELAGTRAASNTAEGVRQALKDFRDSIPEGTTVTVRSGDDMTGTIIAGENLTGSPEEAAKHIAKGKKRGAS